MINDLLALSAEPAVQFFLIIVSALISEDLTILATGVLIAEHRIDLITGLIACFTGLFLGDFGLYLIGRSKLSERALKYFKLENKVQSLKLRFDSNFLAVLALARCVPGLRLPVYFSAGLFKVDSSTFLKLILIFNLIWTISILSIAIYFQNEAQNYFGAARFYVVIVIALIWLLIRRFAAKRQ